MITGNYKIKLMSQEIHKNVFKVDLRFRKINLDFGFKLAAAFKKLFSKSFFSFIEEESICASLVKLMSISLYIHFPKIIGIYWFSLNLIMDLKM